MYRLFHKVILLDSGNVVYHGPSDQILNHFLGLNFHIPVGQDLADFLQEVTSGDGEKLSMVDLTTHYRRTPHYKGMIAELETPKAKGEWNHVQQTDFLLPWSRATRLCLWRQYLLLKRNKIFLVAQVCFQHSSFPSLLQIIYFLLV